MFIVQLDKKTENKLNLFIYQLFCVAKHLKAFGMLNNVKQFITYKIRDQNNRVRRAILRAFKSAEFKLLNSRDLTLGCLANNALFEL